MLANAQSDRSRAESGIPPRVRSCCLSAVMLWSLGACAAHQAPSAPAAPPDPQIAESAPAGGDAAPVPGDNRPVPEASTCNKTRLFEVGSTSVWQTPGKKVFFFSAGMTIDADGAPTPITRTTSARTIWATRAGRETGGRW